MLENNPGIVFMYGNISAIELIILKAGFNLAVESLTLKI